MNESNIAETMQKLLDKHSDGFYETNYEGGPFLIIVEGPNWVRMMVNQAKQMYPDEISMFEDILGYALGDKFQDNWGFSDQWYECINCNEAIDITPQHACWMPDFWLVDGEGYICGDCLRNNEDWKQEYLEFLDGNYKHPNTVLNLKEEGFERLTDDYYCRMFEHCDCPKPIMKKMRKKYPKNMLVFNLDAQDPFQQNYSIYRKEVQET